MTMRTTWLIWWSTRAGCRWWCFVCWTGGRQIRAPRTCCNCLVERRVWIGWRRCWCRWNMRKQRKTWQRATNQSALCRCLKFERGVVEVSKRWWAVDVRDCWRTKEAATALFYSKRTMKLIALGLLIARLLIMEGVWSGLKYKINRFGNNVLFAFFGYKCPFCIVPDTCTCFAADALLFINMK